MNATARGSSLIRIFTVVLLLASATVLLVAQQAGAEYMFASQWGGKGSGDGQFNVPTGVTVDSKTGDIYVADFHNHRIQRFDSTGTPDSYFLTTWVGKFVNPRGVMVDGVGDVYVSDWGDNRIKKLYIDQNIFTKWGGGSTDSAQPKCLTILGLLDDMLKNKNKVPFVGQMKCPSGIATDPSGNVYVADTFNHRIQKFSSNGKFIIKWGSKGSEAGQFIYPFGIATDSSGNVYVSDTLNDRIQKFNSSGDYLTMWGGQGSYYSQLNWPTGIATDPSGNVYIADTFNDRIQKFSPSGKFIAMWGSKGSGKGHFNRPQGIATDLTGNIYVADTDNNRIQKFSPYPYQLKDFPEIPVKRFPR